MIEYDEKAARATERSYLSPEIVRQRLCTLAVLALRAGEHGLDVGCGPGLLAHDMALQVGTSGRVAGIDKSEAMLKLARQRCAHLSQVKLSQGEAENLSADDKLSRARLYPGVALHTRCQTGAQRDAPRIETGRAYRGGRNRLAQCHAQQQRGGFDTQDNTGLG